ncbi:hypothetical protein MHAS44199_24865 [Mycolicibacterium hassiacum DSM 44199]|nr:hypothetical protein [Mycolicibacterium hassiacum DSM 44199]
MRARSAPTRTTGRAPTPRTTAALRCRARRATAPRSRVRAPSAPIPTTGAVTTRTTGDQTRPSASMASATRMNPAMLAPAT